MLSWTGDIILSISTTDEMSSGQYLTTYVISGNISATPDGEGMFWLLSQPAP
nr:MAG TPA: hypothetical protein [Caudoviricetes sp.]